MSTTNTPEMWLLLTANSNQTDPPNSTHLHKRPQNERHKHARDEHRGGWQQRAESVGGATGPPAHQEGDHIVRVKGHTLQEQGWGIG